MLEQFLPGLSPKSPTQSDIQYAFKLYGVNEIGSALMDRFFKTRKEQLEERVLERQLEMMGENPDTQALNKAVMAAKAAEYTPGFIASLTSTAKTRPALTLADVLTRPDNVVDFRIPMAQARAAYAKRAAKALAKAI